MHVSASSMIYNKFMFPHTIRIQMGRVKRIWYLSASEQRRFRRACAFAEYSAEYCKILGGSIRNCLQYKMINLPQSRHLISYLIIFVTRSFEKQSSRQQIGYNHISQVSNINACTFNINACTFIIGPQHIPYFR